ncbi:MAG: helix-turn-helix domain-containing protein [Pseudomonadota bacterium]
MPDQLTCPMDDVLGSVTGRWTTYILWLLDKEGPLRFGELMGLMPRISAKVLTDRLRLLERQGIVIRTQKPTIPPEVSYALSPQGAQLRTALLALHDVALNWRDQGWTPEAGFPKNTSA